MASTFQLSKTYGTSPGTTKNGMTYMHLTADDAENDTSTAYQNSGAQITVPTSGTTYSKEGWYFGKWTGTYNSITSPKVWKSSGSLGTGVGINAGVTTSYVTPVGGATQSTLATSAVPTSEGAALTPSVIGSAPTNTSQYVVLQLTVASTASPGDISEQQYTWKWTES
jgi:hypothetical protein